MPANTWNGTREGYVTLRFGDLRLERVNGEASSCEIETLQPLHLTTNLKLRAQTLRSQNTFTEQHCRILGLMSAETNKTVLKCNQWNSGPEQKRKKEVNFKRTVILKI